MSDIFVSHAEEDASLALQIARSLEEKGYGTWCFELDMPAGDYLHKISEAVGKCPALLVVVSRHSLESNQVYSEVVQAFEDQKLLIPILRGVTDAEYKRRYP
jgi:hypothetical protein